MSLYQTEVSEFAVGALRERSVALPDAARGWTKLLVYGRDSYFNNRLLATIRADQSARHGRVRVRIRALGAAQDGMSRSDAMQYGVARYYDAPRLLADLVEQVDRTFPSDAGCWRATATASCLTAERRFSSARADPAGALLDHLVADLWPLEHTYIAIDTHEAQGRGRSR